ncbi:MAG: alpha/beta hydrolase [Chitinophagaceae bacterium]
MKQLLTALAVCLLLASCQKDADPNGGDAPVNAESQTNVAYGTDPLQKMDIYLPSGRTTAATKVIILIHGGAWNQGDKADFNTYVDTLKKRLPDYAIFNINYRLATGTSNFFPVQENDVKAAIDFIYSKRSEYKISDKFVLLGASAGGHLALLQAYKNTSPVRIKAVVDFFGPTDLVDMYNNPVNPLIPIILTQVTGGDPSTKATLYHDSSPVNYVTGQSPPTILLHGGVDIVVAYSQSVMLNTALQSAGVTHQYVFYPTENHGWTGANLTDSFDKISAFLAANVN